MISVKRLLCILFLLTSMISVNGCDDTSKGDDVGGENEDITIVIKETTSLQEIDRDEIDIMKPVFESLIRVIESGHGYSSADTNFITAAVNVLFSITGESHDDITLLDEYVRACFYDIENAPEDSYTGTAVPYSGKIQITDIMDNGDETYTAYVSYVSDDETIINIYIFTLINNGNEDNKIFPYRVKAVVAI